MLIEPGLINSVEDILTCVTVDGVAYMKPDFSVICWSDDHYNSIYYLVIPIIAVWIIGYYSLILTLLYRMRKDLDNPDNIRKLGYFYMGFTDRLFFW